MGKRGPMPKGEFGDKSAVLSTRISAELRSALEASVKETGLTLSREIEHRLRRTFDDREKFDLAFGSERNFRLLQMVAAALQTSINPADPSADWLDDPVAFEIAKRTVLNVFEAARPPGSTPQLDALSEFATIDRPARIWKDIQDADATLPLADTGRKRVANRIKSALGDVALRPNIFSGNADDLRAEASPAKATKSKHRRAT